MLRRVQSRFTKWDSQPRFQQWYFYHCDYPRYETMRPQLRQAQEYVDFGSLALNPESREVIADFAENQLSIYEARQAMVETQCCLGEPFVVGKTFVRIPRYLKRFEEGSTASALLEDLLFGGLNMKDWNKEPERLIGVLTPEERRALASSMGIVLNSSIRPRSRPLPIPDKILNGLFDTPSSNERVVIQFLRFLAQAKSEETGLLAFLI